MILKLADQRKDTIKPLSLTKNYRSHSGVLEFAATFLTQLDVCFPDSFQKLDADFGLSRGPRPGCWTAPKGMASLRAALKLDQRLIVLTRDEHAKQLEVLLGENDPELASTVNVLGICESKGLEFNDVILVDFFSTAPKHLQEAWNKLLNLKVGIDKAKSSITMLLPNFLLL
jgi:ATP-dependent exoDNAse (exonuclease V) beta subunit